MIPLSETKELPDWQIQECIDKLSLTITQSLHADFILYVRKLNRNRKIIPKNFFYGRPLSYFVTSELYKSYPLLFKQFILFYKEMRIFFIATKGPATFEHPKKYGFTKITIRDGEYLNNLSHFLSGHGKKDVYDNAMNIRDSISHELTHAFDFWISNKRFANRKQSMEWLQGSNLFKNDPNKENYDIRNSTYINQSLELNAVFRQTIAMLPDPQTTKWTDYFIEFINSYQFFEYVNIENRKKLAKRLAKYWLQKQNP